MRISAPELLTADHDLSRFTCQHESLTDWLKKRALANNQQHGSRTHVACDGVRVVGFHALAAGSLEHATAPKSLTRNMPKPIPAIVLARLAVDTQYQGRGIGAGLLKDAVFRAVAAAKQIAARALLCHAIDDEARSFYLKHGFLQSPIENLTVMLDLRKVLSVQSNTGRPISSKNAARRTITA